MPSTTTENIGLHKPDPGDECGFVPTIIINTNMDMIDAVICTVPDGYVTTDKLGAQAVTEPKISPAAVTPSKIQDLAVTEDKIAAGAVTTAELGPLAVTDAKLAADAVTTPKITALAITDAKLADSAVTTDKLNALAVTTGKIAADAVTTNELGGEAVTTDQLGAAAVTEAKIGPDAVTADHVKDAELLPVGLAVPDSITVAFGTASLQRSGNNIIVTVPESDPVVTDALWSDSGVLKLSAGT